ncbi:MAG: OprO/OprP family phosphate-selective porin [Tannerellaceae bacterium]|jgi:hypothetical protein|nr:OprO/OprP family phosphate-selective porin [Tannerellaceae bacterium]
MKKIKIIVALIPFLVGGNAIWAQEAEPTPVERLEMRADNMENAVRLLQKFKVSGYIQTQFQYAEPDADGINFKLANRANSWEQSERKDYGRFGIRRGRLKLLYEDGIATGVVQIDVTDKGIASDRNVVTFKDVYLQVKDPAFGTNSLKAGVFDRPFGHEISWSSSRRESPERSRIMQSLFPDERDLGVMLTLQPAKSSALNVIKLEAGLFVGNGIRPQMVSRMDFIAHLSGELTLGNNSQIGGGLSAYLGGVFRNDSSVFVMSNGRFVPDANSSNRIGSYSPRRYFGVDLRYGIITAAGLTQLRCEYIGGLHPGNASGAYDFKFNSLPAPANIYMRHLSGAYVTVAQDLGSLPLTAVVKYDFYDPNANVKGDGVGAEGSATGRGDITMYNLGGGIFWRINPALRLTAYCDFTRNETSANLSGYEADRSDNVFTLRLQYKF